MAIIQATGLKTGDTIEYHGALCTILAKREKAEASFRAMEMHKHG
jgi:hypothetical protein